MKKLKKLFAISIGIIIIPFMLASFIISCGQKKIKENEEKEEETEYKTNAVKPLDFNVVFGTSIRDSLKDEPIFFTGINYTAYAQGMSFIFNILKGLGWNWENIDKINKLYDSAFDFKSLNIETNVNSNFDKELISTKFENDFSTAFESWKNVANFIEIQVKKDTNDKSLPLIDDWRLYNQFSEMKNIGAQLSPIEIKNVDALSAVEINLGDDFSSLIDKGKKYERIANKLNDKRVLNKIFNDKKYVYSWNGRILKKLGFQIQSNKMIIWHYSNNLNKLISKISSIRTINTDLQKHINKNPNKDNQKNLSQVYLDPAGAEGSISESSFVTSTNLKTKKMKTKDSYFEADINDYLLGYRTYDYNKKTFNFSDDNSNNKIFIPTYSSFIDGGKPGTVILKMYEGSLLNDDNIHGNELVTRYPLKTLINQNRIQTFYKIKNPKKQKDLKKLIYMFLMFLKKEATSESNSIKQFKWVVSPLTISIIEFLKNNNITEENIGDAFDKYNNGSHYMLAVEIFLRGMENIPEKFNSHFITPSGIKLFEALLSIKRKDTEIVGMSNVNNLYAMIFFMYTSSKEDSKGQYYFNPATLDWTLEEDEYKKRIMEDLSAKRKTGKETKSYPL